MAINEPHIEQTVTRRRGFWSRFRRNAKREPTHTEDDEDDNYKRPSQANIISNVKPLPQIRQIILDHAPSAREAAFSGPPRYDWIDIETAAAMKIQAAYRRHRVMNQLGTQGYSTVAIRDRARRRDDASHYMPKNNMFACCVFAFASDDEALHQYASQKKARTEREAQLRAQYRRKQNARESSENPIEEAFEVVE